MPQWSQALAHQVTAWSSTSPFLARRAGALPAPFLLLALRGEGVLRTRFGNWATQPMLAQAPDQALGLWDKLWQDGTELTYLCERIGLARLASQQAAIPVPDWPIQRALYAGFVYALAQGGHSDLLKLATDKVFELALARLYPASSEARQRTTIATSRQRAQLHLQKALTQPVKLRESFSVQEGIAHMALRMATAKGEWQDLLQCTGTRLKPLKLQAYQAVMDMPAADLRVKFSGLISGL